MWLTFGRGPTDLSPPPESVGAIWDRFRKDLPRFADLDTGVQLEFVDVWRRVAVGSDQVRREIPAAGSLLTKHAVTLARDLWDSVLSTWQTYAGALPADPADRPFTDFAHAMLLAIGLAIPLPSLPGRRLAAPRVTPSPNGAPRPKRGT